MQSLWFKARTLIGDRPVIKTGLFLKNYMVMRVKLTS